MNIVDAIGNSGIQLDLLSINQPDSIYVSAIERAGGKIYIQPRSGKEIIRYWCNLRKIIKGNCYDIVHIHGNSHTTFLELSASRAAGCVVGMVHAHTTTCSHVVVHQLLTPLFNMLCTHRIACGEMAGKFMFGNIPFLVFHNGIDTNRFGYDENARSAIRQKLGWERNEKVIGHVGYFSEVKNHQFIVDVFEELYSRDHGYRLLLVGDGELKERIEKRLGGFILGNVAVLTGNVDNVNEYLNAMDLILMPSLYEGLPLSLIEQQANGLKCVVSDAITREVDKTGNVSFLSLSLSAKDWADYVAAISPNNSRAEKSSQAVKLIKAAGYSMYDEVEELKKIYEDAVEK